MVALPFLFGTPLAAGDGGIDPVPTPTPSPPGILPPINVPLAPGVPPLLRHSSDPGEEQATDNAVQAAPATSLDWGVYDRGGNDVLLPDSVGGIEFSQDYRISDYPMEAGEFGSYNKVATPWTNRVMVTKGGSLADRQDFETRLQHLVPSLDLYNIVTPERAYLECNITGVRLGRNQDRGAGMLMYEIEFVQIRQTGEIEFDDDDAGSAATATGTSDGTAPKTTPVDKPAAKKPVVKTPRTPAAARKRSRGSVQSRVTSKLTDDSLIKMGFRKLANGDFVMDL